MRFGGCGSKGFISSVGSLSLFSISGILGFCRKSTRIDKYFYFLHFGTVLDASAAELWAFSNSRRISSCKFTVRPASSENGARFVKVHPESGL